MELRKKYHGLFSMSSRSREEVITCEFFMKTFVWCVWAEIRFGAGPHAMICFASLHLKGGLKSLHKKCTSYGSLFKKAN